MSVLRFCFLLGLMIFAFGQGSTAKAINFVQFGIMEAGWNPNGTCYMAGEITGMGNSNDSNTSENFDYFGVIEWVDYPNSTQAIKAGVQTVVKGQFFALPYELNLLGNYQLYPTRVIIYELSSHPGLTSSLRQVLSYIVSNSQGETVFEFYPAECFAAPCLPYQPQG